MGLLGPLVKFLGGLLSVAVLTVSLFVGWLIQSPQGPAEGIMYATLIPLLGGKLPPTIFGHGRMSGTDPVPEDLTPQPRPADELFLDLPFDQRMPQNGLGMCCRPTAYDHELAERSVLWYLLLGGRLIDTAYLYLNHPAVGRGIRSAMERGVPREEIFVTTKHWPRFFGYNTTLTLVPTFLEELGLDYVDLLLMHAPAQFPPGLPGGSDECDALGLTKQQCRQETWRALSELRRQGLLRNIGVSNFGVHHLRDLEDLGLDPVAVNQILYNPWAPDYQVDIFEYCREKNIAVTAYMSLGGLIQKSEAVSTQVLLELSEKYHVSPSQVILRWVMQKGAAVIPGTGNPKHMEENLAIYAFEISDEDMRKIDELRKDEVAKKFFYVKPSSD